MTDTPILEVADLHKRIPICKGLFSRKVGEWRILNGISFALNHGDIMGCVGESGSGKTVLLQCLIGLATPTSGEVRFEGKELRTTRGQELKAIRRQMQLVLQDPVGSLHPRMTIGMTLKEPLSIHHIGTPAERAQRVRDLLGVVGLDPEMADRYPHQFSGGQRQRIGIARALALNPKVILADEPVSALDVSLAAQVLNLFLDLQEEFDLTYLIVAHDMAVLRQLCTKLAVMYAGRFVETGLSQEVYSSPQHPYTLALLASSPSIRRSLTGGEGIMVPRGESPDPAHVPAGCPFHPRCDYALEICHLELPPLRQISPTHSVLCHVFPRS